MLKISKSKLENTKMKDLVNEISVEFYNLILINVFIISYIRRILKKFLQIILDLFNFSIPNN